MKIVYDLSDLLELALKDYSKKNRVPAEHLESRHHIPEGDFQGFEINVAEEFKE